MRSRFFGLVAQCIKLQPTEIIPVSAVNSPPVTRQQLLEGMPKAKGGQKHASTDTRLSDVGISYDQSLRWQKLAAVSEEKFEPEAQDKTHMPITARMK